MYRSSFDGIAPLLTVVAIILALVVLGVLDLDIVDGVRFISDNINPDALRALGF